MNLFYFKQAAIVGSIDTGKLLVLHSATAAQGVKEIVEGAARGSIKGVTKGVGKTALYSAGTVADLTLFPATFVDRFIQAKKEIKNSGSVRPISIKKSFEEKNNIHGSR